VNKKPISILIIEDNPDDALLIRRFLGAVSRVSYEVTHADQLQRGLQYLKNGTFNLILLDLGLPDGNGLLSFNEVHANAPDVPVIVLTGNNDDEVAIEAVQKGAQDFLAKDQVTAVLLDRSIRYAIERQKLLIQIENSSKEIKTLRGFLPICANCKKIRDDKGYWTQIEAYISERSDVIFSHGLCIDCFKKLYPNLKAPDESS